jgi:hypothetical protein
MKDPKIKGGSFDGRAAGVAGHRNVRICYKGDMTRLPLYQKKRRKALMSSTLKVLVQGL